MTEHQYKDLIHELIDFGFRKGSKYKSENETYWLACKSGEGDNKIVHYQLAVLIYHWREYGRILNDDNFYSVQFEYLHGSYDKRYDVSVSDDKMTVQTFIELGSKLYEFFTDSLHAPKIIKTEVEF